MVSMRAKKRCECERKKGVGLKKGEKKGKKKGEKTVERKGRKNGYALSGSRVRECRPQSTYLPRAGLPPSGIQLWLFLFGLD